jgi:hypothetical protein
MFDLSAPRPAGLWTRCVTGFRQLPGALTRSLDPKTEAEAAIVEAQLDMLRTSFRLFDYTLPLAGAVIWVFARHASPVTLGIWWALLCANCGANEVILSRPAREGESVIARARHRARRQVVLCTVFTGVWSFVAVLLWKPDFEPNALFIEFLLCCTLAATATMASLHVTSSVIPLLGLSSAVIIVPTLINFRSHIIVLGSPTFSWRSCSHRLG